MPELSETAPQIKPLETPEETSPFVVGSLGVALGVVLLTGGLFFLKAIKNSQFKQAEAEYRQDVEEEMQTPAFQKQEEEVDKVGLQVETLKGSLAEREFFSKLLDEIPLITLKYTQFTHLAVGEDKDVTLEGRTQTFVDLARTLASFKQSPNFQEVALTSANIDTENKQVVFSFNFKLGPEALKAAKPTGQEAPLPDGSPETQSLPAETPVPTP